MAELETVTLETDISNYDLKKGDMGAVVHVYTDPEGYEVEFVTLGGETVPVLTVAPDPSSSCR